MYVSHLSLTDFRSYHQAELTLEPGVTALVGPNGQGKTNLVEAIGYVATLSSHRVPTDAALVRAGASRAVVRARAVRTNDGADRAAVIEVEITPGKANRARVNGGSPTRARDIVGIVRTVLFAPEDLALVKGDPDGRRRFCDELVVLLAPRYAGVVADYDRILKQRSALLKSAGATQRSRGTPDLRTLDVWDARLAHTGAELIAARLAMVRAIAPRVASAYEQVSAGQGVATLSYRSSLVEQDDDGAWLTESPSAELIEARLLEAMGRLRQREVERGVCLVGPHRDDLLLMLGGLPAKGYASHGESWSYALALRLASWELLTAGAPEEPSLWVADVGVDAEPILILDDVFAELDVRRRQRLAELVAPARQVLVTAAVPGDVPEQLSGGRVDVMAGELTRVI